jgi:hypothetical protein
MCERTDELDLLRAELRAIEFFDAAYLRNRSSDESERIAFAMRRVRREEIIRRTAALCPKSHESRP